MAVLAAMAELLSRLPGAPLAWRRLRDRLGHLEDAQRAGASALPAVWVHAASVGELNAVQPILRAIRQRMPGRQVVVSTLTRTGLARARAMSEVHVALLLPLDATRPVRRLTAAFQLEAFLFTETEIWPTWLDEMERLGVPTFMVSGRVSERTAARAPLLRLLFRRSLRSVTCCMQTAADATRMVAIGADPGRVQVAGSLKDEAAAPESPRVAAFGRWLDGGGRRLIVAGSTHEGEDRPILEAYARVRGLHPEVVLLLAPRHPERFAAVAKLVEECSLGLLRFSQVDGTEASARAAQVVLLDEMGPLAECYRAAVVAFVGGSLVEVGGHNVLEPAAVGTPVIVGPHTANAADATQRLLDAGGAMRVSSAESLALALDHVIAEPGVARAMGERAQAAARAGQGALGRHLKILAARLTAARFARGPAA
jgi:3-deoxy-D-manno-octulosonic-acid transferase